MWLRGRKWEGGGAARLGACVGGMGVVRMEYKAF